jgi:hypothetical protein
MKFYRDKNCYIYFKKIKHNKLNAVYSSYFIQFFKNGLYHNSKNADHINDNYLMFCLNNKCYGYQEDFTKHSWRKFAKLQAFL